jgi:hypothetical protein
MPRQSLYKECLPIWPNWGVRSELRDNVTFRYPAELVGDEEDGAGILVVAGSGWFVTLLNRVPGLKIELELCQEDWGIVAFADRNGKSFWSGLSFYDEASGLHTFITVRSPGFSGSAELATKNCASSLPTSTACYWANPM